MLCNGFNKCQTLVKRRYSPSVLPHTQLTIITYTVIFIHIDIDVITIVLILIATMWQVQEVVSSIFAPAN